VFAQANPQITINKPTNINITDIGVLISSLVGILLILSALIAFFYLIMGGISWITSGGDKAAMETARNHSRRRMGSHDPRPEFPGRPDYRRSAGLPQAVLSMLQ